MSECAAPHTDSPSNAILMNLEACIHCGMCLPACPTYEATGSEAESPRGRLYLMKELMQGMLEGSDVQPHLDQCLACHACETACPSAVQYGQILLDTREQLAGQKHSPARALKRLIFKHILPRHGLLLALGAGLRFYQRSGIQKRIRVSGLLEGLSRISGIDLAAQDALLPTIPNHHALPASSASGGERVALLVGCVMDIFYNPVHWDTATALKANGYEIVVPPQTCCGALAHHAGETDITRDLARRNIDSFLSGKIDWIAVNSAGCGSTMKDYPHLLAEDPMYADKARLFSDKVVDVMELLAKKPLKAMRQPIEATVTYHPACHLYHVQKVKTQPLTVLSQIPGLKFIELPQAETCCGSAGLFNVEHPALSAGILDVKMQAVTSVCQRGASELITGNPGCMLQIEKGVQDAGLSMRVRHPISVVADAYRPLTQEKPA